MNEPQVKFTVRYRNTLVGTYQTTWDTEEEALREADYDHHMNGHDVEVFRVEATRIANYTTKENHDDR